MHFFQKIFFFITYYLSSKRFRRSYFHHKVTHITLHQYRAIYLVIPKVACSSIKGVFAQLLGKNKNSIHDSSTFDRINKEKVTDIRFEKYFKFALVRNPWDRIVSCYLNKVSNQLDQQPVSHRGEEIFSRYKWWNPNMTFSEFVTAISKTPDIYSDEHFKSQYCFIYNDDNVLLADFVGKLENINNDFTYICSKLHIQNIEVPHDNASPRKHYSEYYDEKTKKIVAERYKRDIELFGYSFEKILNK